MSGKSKSTMQRLYRRCNVWVFFLKKIKKQLKKQHHMKDKSLLFEIKKITDPSTKNLYQDHLLVMTEMDNTGNPLGFCIKTQGPPFAILGMIDVLVEKLQETRDRIFADLNKAESLGKSIGKLPIDMIMKLKELEAKATEAMKNNDTESLLKIKAEADAILKTLNDFNPDSDKKDSNPGDFNINDFKGGF